MCVKKARHTSSVVVRLKEHFVMYLLLVKVPAPFSTSLLNQGLFSHFLMLFDVCRDVGGKKGNGSMEKKASSLKLAWNFFPSFFKYMSDFC